MLYIRQGKWCECERSCNTASDKINKLEKGGSVHKCNRVNQNQWQIVDSKTFTQIQNNYKNQPNLIEIDTWFLVEGQCIGLGGDEEPLLKDVVPRKIVKWEKDNFFIETEEPISDYHKNHPDYPNCRCKSLDESIEPESMESD